jgi:F1F0 ATPase subunit 2
MNWVTAISSGFGLGLLYFGGLWRTVRMCQLRSICSTHQILNRLLRLGMVSIVFHALLKSGGITALLTGLVGMLVARRFIIREMGRKRHGG